MTKSATRGNETLGLASTGAESIPYFYSRSQRKAYELVVEAIKSQNAFFVLIGEAGIGKTTFLEHINRQLPKDQNSLSFKVSGSHLSVEDFIAQLSDYFRAEFNAGNDEGRSLSEVTNNLGRGLGVPASRILANVGAIFLDKLQLDKPLLILIDDAHELPVRTVRALVQLNEVRNTSNRAERGNLLFILAGRPKLRELLKSSFAGCEPAVHRLGPLEPDELPEYFQIRLPEVIGSNDVGNSELECIATSSKGNPARINASCSVPTKAPKRRRRDTSKTLKVDRNEVRPAPVDSSSGRQQMPNLDAEREAPSKKRRGNRLSQERSPESGLQQLLSEAKQQFWEGRLITPEGDNALETCRKILTLDPDSLDAATGIASIKKEITHLAFEAKARGDWKALRQHLEVILSIDPTDQDAQQAHANLQYEAAVDTLQSALVQRKNVLGDDLQPKHRSDSPSPIVPRQVAFSAMFGLVLFFGGGFLIHQKYEQGTFRVPYIAATSTKPLQSAGKLKQMEAEIGRLLQLKAAHMQQAVVGQGKRDWTAARAELEQVLAIDDSDEAAQAMLFEVVQAQEVEAEVNALLQLAAEQFSAGQLTSLEGDSALASYREVLSYEPQHTEALAGIERIKAVYMERAV
ncbi:MAG: AAA family ATPase, partial [Gammaproteobacteria bacterium]|nr:AAA family ATPase [Gammaproteobacteria bacterium]